MLKSDDFKVIESETVFKSIKIQIDRCKIKLSDNQIVSWDCEVLPDLFFGIPVVDNSVLMTKEWRLGPNTLVTQFTAARCIHDNFELNLNELKREMKEELGLEGGVYTKLVSSLNGLRTTGRRTYFIVKDFKLLEPKRDSAELQDLIKLPIRNLFSELERNHNVTMDTLLMAKLIESKYS